MSLFEKLNAPFRYEDYKIDNNDLVYVSGQAVAERLNEVLGVGYWKYSPVEDSIQLIDRNNKQEKYLLVKFSFYNEDLKEWIEFIDAGTQELNKRMGHGDSTKSAITDGMKKCASRIGVASDVYKGLLKSNNKTVILPEKYKAYYQEQGWEGVFEKSNKPVAPVITKPVEPVITKPVNPVINEPVKPVDPVINKSEMKVLKGLMGGNIKLGKEVLLTFGYISCADILQKDFDKICKAISHKMKAIDMIGAFKDASDFVEKTVN